MHEHISKQICRKWAVDFLHRINEGRSDLAKASSVSEKSILGKHLTSVRGCSYDISNLFFDKISNPHPSGQTELHKRARSDALRAGGPRMRTSASYPAPKTGMPGMWRQSSNLEFQQRDFRDMLKTNALGSRVPGPLHRDEVDSNWRMRVSTEWVEKVS